MRSPSSGARSTVSLLCLGVAMALLGGCEVQPSVETLARMSGELPPNEVTIVATEYAFDVPDTLPAGPTLFALDNEGRVRHEVCFGRLLDGLSMDEALEREAHGDEALDQNPACLFADEGSAGSGQLLVDLEPGRRYGMICDFREDAESPAHVELGMYDSFVAE